MANNDYRFHLVAFDLCGPVAFDVFSIASFSKPTHSYVIRLYIITKKLIFRISRKYTGCQLKALGLLKKVMSTLQAILSYSQIGRCVVAVS